VRPANSLGSCFTCVELRLAPCPDPARVCGSHYLEHRLDPAIFFRAGRKHLLNLRFIESIDPWANGGFLVSLKGGFEVEMSRRQAQKFKEVMSL
jgi:hypothetical protein